MATRLQNSFHTLYRALEKVWIARRAVAAILIVNTLLLGYSAYTHSPTLNEPAHLVAGLSHWRFCRFDLYRVNPPLIRMIATLPLMALRHKEDWSGFDEAPGDRPEMAMGERFVAANGYRSFFLIMVARWSCIPFSWIGAIVCYLWACNLYGRPAGVFSCLIWCFEPNILAHASLITPDAHATALGLAACYMFWRWLKKPNWTQVVLTGVALGLAELAKATLIVFYPMWSTLWLIYRLFDCHSMSVRSWMREGAMLGVQMAIGLNVLNFGYGFEGSLTQLKDLHFVSALFTEEPDGTSGIEHRVLDNDHRLPKNRFVGTWLGRLPMPFPENYVSGFDLQQRDFEHYRRPSYLHGEWRDRGWWYYYIYACVIKTPLSLWFLGFLVLGSRIWMTPCADDGKRVTRSQSELLLTGSMLPGSQRNEASWVDRKISEGGRLRDEFVLLFPLFLIFLTVSAKTGFSEHIRYVLPAFPFIFIATSQVCQAISPAYAKTSTGPLTAAAGGVNCMASRPDQAHHYMPLFSASLVFTLGLWLIASSVWIYPHSLSYANELVGGPHGCPAHLLSSNFDWGQDLRYLQKKLLSAHYDEQHAPFYLAYFGGFDPRSVGLPPSGTLLRDQPLPLLGDGGIYAISANFIFGMPGQAYGGVNGVAYLEPGILRDFQRVEPAFFAGYSIRCFQMQK